MNALKLLAQRWWRVIIFFIWLLMLADLLRKKAYLDFLRPEFGIVLAAGLFTLACFTLIGIIRMERTSIGLPEILRGLIILTPIVFIMNARGVSLDAYTLKKRLLSIPGVADKNPVIATPKKTLASPSVEKPPISEGQKKPVGEDSANKDTPENIDNDKKSYLELEITDIFRSAHQYQEKDIEIIGMYMGRDEVKKIAGKNAALVFRFVITCCVADAVPAAIVVNSSELVNFEDNSWVKVRGTFDIREKNGKKFLIIDNAKITETDTPDQIYLY